MSGYFFPRFSFFGPLIRNALSFCCAVFLPAELYVSRLLSSLCPPHENSKVILRRKTNKQTNQQKKKQRLMTHCIRFEGSDSLTGLRVLIRS